jgi:hypothetical protein
MKPKLLAGLTTASALMSIVHADLTGLVGEDVATAVRTDAMPANARFHASTSG